MPVSSRRQPSHDLYQPGQRRKGSSPPSRRDRQSLGAKDLPATCDQPDPLTVPAFAGSGPYRSLRGSQDSTGGALPKGFPIASKRSSKESDFPIHFAETRIAADPLTATAKGALVAAHCDMEG